MPATLMLPLLLAAQTPFEDLAALDARLAQVSDGRALALDPRLRLARCPVPAAIDTDATGMLLASCPDAGWKLRILMRAAAPAAALGPVLIQRGESVAVTIHGDDFALSYQGTAIEPGRKGDAVRVKFVPGGKILVATVAGHGRVEIVD